MKSIKLAYASLATIFFLTTAASAALISQGKPVSGGTFYNSGCETFPQSNIDDGAFGDTGAPCAWSFWLSAQGVTNDSVTIDLGSLYAINQFQVQDTHNRGFFDRGTDHFGIDVSANGILFTSVVASGFSLADWQNLNVLIFNVNTAGRYVRFDALDSYGGNNSVGINELQVYGTPQIAGGVPEPATLALFGAGLAGLGALRRRRKAKV